MRIDNYTKVIFTIASVALLGDAGMRWKTSVAIVHAASPQISKHIWEYKTFERSWGWTGTDKKYLVPDYAKASCYEDDSEIVGCEATTAMLKRLGAQGWELVTIMPLSVSAGGGISGATSSELWVFKRLKS